MCANIFSSYEKVLLHYMDEDGEAAAEEEDEAGKKRVGSRKRRTITSES
jgi:hypothetical protein